MTKTFEKHDDNTLKVTEEETKTVERTYNLNFLNSQREQILKDQERIEAELIEVISLISEAAKLGITEEEEGDVI